MSGHDRGGAAVYVCTDPGVPAYGAKGCSVHVQEVLRRLVVRFGEVHLITTRPGGGPPPELADVHVHALPRPSGGDVAARERAQCAVDAAAADVVAALVGAGRRRGLPVGLVYQRYALWSAATLETARALGVPSVLEINAPLLAEQAAHRGLVDADRAARRTARLFGAAAAPFAVSGPVARWAQTLDPHRRPVAVVPNGVDVERFTPAGPRPGGGHLTVAFSGTFKPWHGLDLLVDATATARAAGPALQLLLIGDGPDHAATLRRAAAAGVPVTATGQVSPGEVPALLRTADIAIAPYPAGEHYFSPLKVAEYLAAGLPTVASAIADVPALVADGTEALLVAPGDTAATAAALARLGADPVLRRRLATGGRRAARERFGWASVVDRTLALAPVPAAVA